MEFDYIVQQIIVSSYLLSPHLLWVQQLMKSTLAFVSTLAQMYPCFGRILLRFAEPPFYQIFMEFDYLVQQLTKSILT